jgi:hypothetical protein
MYNLGPNNETLDPLPVSVHWLFCATPLPPGVIVLAGCPPPSVSSASEFWAGL